MRLGRQHEPIGVEEVPDDAKPPILREYLRRWNMETGKFFEGVTAESPEPELRRIAPHHPFLALLALIVAVYIASAELAKRFFYRALHE